MRQITLAVVIAVHLQAPDSELDSCAYLGDEVEGYLASGPNLGDSLEYAFEDADPRTIGDIELGQAGLFGSVQLVRYVKT